MNTRALFGLGMLGATVGATMAGVLFVWPALLALPRTQGLIWVVAPHMVRVMGLSFLIPGVVGSTLPAAWARPAAYGDYLAAILAMIATWGLAHSAGWAIAAVWVFVVWGVSDLLLAIYRGQRIDLDPGALGAGYYVVSTIVPLFLVSHALTVCLLLRGNAP